VFDRLRKFERYEFLLAIHTTGMIAFAVGHPMDTVKVHQQLKGKKTLEATKYIYQVKGLRGTLRHNLLF
jgi:hypothetical protein